jgi:hypothetical protein
VISRTAGLGRLHAFETEPGKIKFVNEDIDDPDRVGICHVIIQQFGEQNALCAVLALYIALHSRPLGIDEMVP